MMSTLDLRGRTLDVRFLRGALPRAEFDVTAALEQVRPICEDVAHRGAEALRDLGERFDGVRPTHLRVPADVLRAALDGLDDDLRAALEEAIRRARLVHGDQRRTDTTTQVVPGGTVTERWVPVDRVGLYVPGGLAVYPSSVIMNVVPAQIAGVGSLAVASPPQRENAGVFAGYPNPTILATCALLGVEEVYAVGGAQAVAMFAYGFVDDHRRGEVDGEPVVCDPVSLVTGPGNIWVVAAKRLLKGLIGIDAEAGPTEIAVLADDSADPDHVAADLISQAEHDPLAASVLVTDSEELADAHPRGAAAAGSRRRSTPSASPRRSRARSRASSSSTTSTPASTSSTRMPPSTSRSRRATPPRWPRACATPARSSSVRTPRSASATTPPAPTTCCPRPGAPATRAACRCSPSCAASTSSTTTRRRCAQVARHVVTLAQAEDLPAHGEAVTARFGDEVPR